LRERLGKNQSIKSALSPRKWSNRSAPRRISSIKKSSRFYGVSWRPADYLWEAKVRVRGTLCYLGLFSCELQAAQAVERSMFDRACTAQLSKIRRLIRRGAGPSKLLPRLVELVDHASSAVKTFPRWRKRRRPDPTRKSKMECKTM
jgi:hypothetical protein